MSDEKATQPAATEVDEGIGKSNCGGITPGNQSSNHVLKMEVDGEDKAVVVSEEVKAEEGEGGELKQLSEAGEVLKGEEDECGEMEVENQSSNHCVKLEVDRERKAVVDMVEVKADSVEGGELQKLNDVGGLLVAEGVEGGEMRVKKICKKKVGRGTCKSTVENEEEFCVKHKSKGTGSDGKSMVKNEEVEDVKREGKGGGESSLVEEGVLAKSERKRKAAKKDCNGSELDVYGGREALGGRKELRARQRSVGVNEYGVDEACAGKTGSRRRKDPAVNLEKVSGLC